MFGSSITVPQKPLETYNPQDVAIIDTADVFDSREEKMVSAKLKEFCNTTGVATQIVTVEYDEWTDNGTLENYALARYYTQFDDENGWLIVYSELENGAGDWSWEGIQGDNTYKVMDTFIHDFNTQFQSQLVVDQMADPANAFIDAFDKSIKAFNNQQFSIEFEGILPALFVLAFISVHGYVMIFAGTRKKYSYKELEEVTDTNQTNTSQTDIKQTEIFECRYCGYKYDWSKDRKCPNCAAINYKSSF
jgi:predicted Zn-ribbon and HTH transcriptional regulator